MPPIKKQKKLVVEPVAAISIAPIEIKPGYVPLERLPIASVFQHIGRECRVHGIRAQLVGVTVCKPGLMIQYFRLPRNKKDAEDQLQVLQAHGETAHLYSTTVRVSFSPGNGKAPNPNWLFEGASGSEFELLMDFKR